ncbi:MAG: VCBS repeat-containing protein [Myxococcota bacterium]
MRILILSLSGVFLFACGDDDDGGTITPEPTGEGEGEESSENGEGEASGATAEPGSANTESESDGMPSSLSRGLLLAYAQFEVEDGQVTARPGPARLEILRRENGEWQTDAVEDDTSNVFHKAMVYEGEGHSGILTLGGTGAQVKLWRNSPEGWTSTTLWEEEFGGRFNRMRDAEIADIYGDGKPSIAVGTHDQGVVAVLRPNDEGFEVVRLDRQENIFVHEIEIGDLNGDQTLEVYATPSEPNTLDGGEQHGEVVRYIPRTEGERTVVADLGNRHAKEIYVGDVDGDGRDELYVAVEALTEGEGSSVSIVEPVEIRRYDADTDPTEGAVVATINDRLCRFLTVGDFDGDGKKEMIAAAFRSGVWLLRPGRDPRGEWSVESVDRDSSGFEHAALATDLDGDGTDELYVASDEQGELRRYVWRNGRPDSEVIHRRELPRSMMTWNIMPVPVTMLAID